MNTTKNQNRICQNCKNDFVIEQEDFNFYEKIKVPPPTFCPECRNIQRMASRNVKSLYKRACDLCGEEVISRFSKQNKTKMYCRDCWWGDNWDAISFKKEYDFSKTFHEQFYDLLFSVPHVSLLNVNMTNSDYRSIQNFKKHIEEIAQKEVVHRENFNLKIFNSDGDNLLDCKNCHNCFTINDSEDSCDCIRGMKHKSVIDTGGCWYSELIGNCSGCVNAYLLKYSAWSSSRYSEYLDLCLECESCFGCVGLKKKKYCILNKQYSKEEYEKLKEKIIKDMRTRSEYGKFLPYSMSAGPFNFSTSFLYFPETKKEDILKLGGYWEDITESRIEGMRTSDLPDSINDVSDDICTKALICPETGWRFNIAVNELSFYKQNNIPLPRLHFDVRIKDNMKFTTVLQAYKYNCFYCKKEINAYYPHAWKYEKIACEECYKQNIN